MFKPVMTREQQQQQQQQPPPPRRAHGPRLYHTKSRLGCLRCKARRVKCDEKRPACTGCSRHLVECVYPAAAVSSRENARVGSSHNPDDGDGDGGGDDGYDFLARPLSSAGSGSRSRQVTSMRTRSASKAGATVNAPMAESGSSNKRHYSGGYVSIGNSSSSSRSNAHPGADGGDDGDDGDGDDDEDGANSADGLLNPPESRERRKTELRLLHHYLLNQSKVYGQSMVPTELTEEEETGGVDGDESENTTRRAGAPPRRPRRPAFVWSVDLMEMAFEHDNILYSLLAHSALSMWVGEGDDDDKRRKKKKNKHLLLQQQYLAMALRAQRQAVGRLGRATADSVCIASLLLVNHSFALVQTLPTEPWQPPREWLQMGRGAGQVLMVAREYLEGEEGEEEVEEKDSDDRDEEHTQRRYTRLTTKLKQTAPYFDRDDMFNPVRAAPYLWMLEGVDDGDDDGDDDGSDCQTIYIDTLAYVGWCAESTARPGEPLNALCRRLAAAAHWFPDALQHLLELRRPRAMLCLAAFFALWIPFRHVWMVGQTGPRQVRAIYAALPPAWRSRLHPLLDEYGLR